MSNELIILPKDFDSSKLDFSYSKAMSSGAKLFFLTYDGSQLYMQAPWTSLAWDAQSYDEGENSKYTVKTNINVSNESSKEFFEKMVEFDNRLKVLGKENSVEWFKKKNLSDDVIDSMFTQTVRVSTDPNTGEPNGQYPPTFGFKIKKKDGNIQCRCFDENKAEINFNDPEGENYMKFENCLKKGAQVKGLFKCDFVWHSPGKFGCSWSACQLKVKVPKGFSEYAFVDDSDEESENLNRENVIESSDEECVEEEA